MWRCVRRRFQKQKQGVDVIVIDSLLSTWNDCGGILGHVDRKSENQTNVHGMAEGNDVVEVVYKNHSRVAVPHHRNAAHEKCKTRIQKIGLKPVRREGIN